jgi:hypothetical protein
MKRPAILLAALLALSTWPVPALARDWTRAIPVAAPAGYPPAGYAHTVQSSQVALYWNCARSDAGSVHVDGMAVNPWSDQPVQFLGFDLVGVDARGHSVSSIHSDARDILLRTNQQTPFTIDLHTAGTEVRFALYYEYQFQDRGHTPFASKTAWDGSSFPQKPPVLLAWTNQFMVRDACSPTQHLVR